VGWKSACIIAGDCPAGYLGTLPAHKPARADEIIKLLGYPELSKREAAKLEVYPDPGTFMIGAYEQAVFLADRDIIFECFDKRDNRYFQNCLSLYPKGKLLIFLLHSVTNYFGYAYYENGALVREFSGSSDDGVVSDVGEPLAEEKACFKSCQTRGDTKVFLVETEGKIEEYGADEYGEELAFQVAGIFFGQPLDRHLDGHNDHFELEMELFKKQSIFLKLQSVFRR
jgi:hypothetical protein